MKNTKRIILCWFRFGMLVLVGLLSVWYAPATSFTEFYCNPTDLATNLNAGSTTSTTPTYVGTAGNWTNTTRTWFKSGEDLSGVSVGDWASVFPDATTGNAVFIGRITAVDDGADTITISAAASAGTAPVVGVADTSIRVGGVWSGPKGASSFPFNFATYTLTNVAGSVPCVNLLGGVDYVITAAMTRSLVGPIRFQGYTSTVRDGGRFKIIDSATAASYTMLTLSSGNSDWVDGEFTNAFSSGSSDVISVSGGECALVRIIAHDARRTGFSITASTLLIECEAYNCNKANSASHGGYYVSAAGSVLIRCYSHDNSTANSSGFVIDGAIALLNCLAESNGSHGFRIQSTTITTLIGCDSYNNGGAGVDLTTATLAGFTLQNCNLIKNGTYGIASSGTLLLRNGLIQNCGFGSGTQTNASGSIVVGLQGMEEASSILYASGVTPWTDPANGDFRISLTAAKAVGRGAFTQSTINAPTNTFGFPDIGAAQSASTNAAPPAGGEFSFPFIQ